MKFSGPAFDVIKTVAPTVATALLGPLGGAATSALLAKLGGGDPKEAEKEILAGNPDTLLKLQEIDADFKKHMADLGVQEDQLAYADTASARDRESKVQDATPQILAYGTTLGFFGILGYMLVHGVPPGSDVLMVMLGSLGTAWTAVVGYYFGSSIGARRSAETLGKIAQQP